MTAHCLLVLGGARSGKSRYAQQRAELMPGRHVFVATAEAGDQEMRDRIEWHRADRDAQWETVEEPRNLPAVLDWRNDPSAVVLIDCLTLWTSNMMRVEADIDQETTALCDAVRRFQGHLILVSNEVGLGIVPDNALARRFRDAAGRVNQAIASVAHEVRFVTAGLSLALK